MRFIVPLASLALFGGLVLAAPASAVTPISGSMDLTVAAGQITSGLFPTYNYDTSADSWSRHSTPLSVSASATKITGLNAVTSTASGTAIWNSPKSGSVDFTNYGWNINSPTLQTSAYLYAGGPDWSYTFVAQRDGALSLDYTVTGGGADTFGLFGWNIGWTGDGGGQTLTVANVFSPDQTGTFTRDLVKGETYTISLTNEAGIATSVNVVTNGQMSGQFNWNIVESRSPGVPEPAGWTLMLTGLAGMGAVLRRRRPAPAI